VSVSVSASWNASFIVVGGQRTLMKGRIAAADFFMGENVM